MRDEGKLLAAWTTRDVAAIVGISGIWALAPLFGTPSSLWVMPLVALAAAAATPATKRALALALASLLILVIPWSVAAVLVGSIPWVQQVVAAMVILAMHAPVVAGLTVGATWARRRFSPRLFSA